jgi:hypothetical protein
VQGRIGSIPARLAVANRSWVTQDLLIDDCLRPDLEAGLFSDWLSGDAGRTVIENYRVRSSQVFFPWPQERSSERPDALPR